MGVYANKSDTARFFGISRNTVYKMIEGIETEIERGRYARCAIAEGLNNKAVFLDYMVNRKRLNDKNLRRTVPEFDMKKCYEYCLEKEIES